MKKYLLGGAVSVATLIGFASVASAAIVVPPPTSLPTTGDQCKKDGWEVYGVFNNQGDCVSYVATDGRNEPANI